MRKAFPWLCLAAAILALPACKKEDSGDSTPSLSGLALDEVVPYVLTGDKVTIQANVRNIAVSKGSLPGGIGLSWQVNSAKRDTLTLDINKSNPAFTYQVDTLGSYDITCIAFAGSGYYSASAVASFRAIDPQTALKGLSGEADTTVGDIKVRTAEINGATWMAQNYYSQNAGLDYKNASAVTSVLGRLYTWEEAKNACPAGWHLPSAAEWDALGTQAAPLMAGASFLDERMWKLTNGQVITNALGFNAIPVGMADLTSSMDKFRGYGQYAIFWTASAGTDADLAQYRYIRYDEEEVKKGEGHISSLALSVRCVKD